MNWKHRIYDVISLLVHVILGTFFVIAIGSIMVLISVFIGGSF